MPAFDPERIGKTDVELASRPNVDMNNFRRKRFKFFIDYLQRSFPKKPVRVLDLGGVIAYWEGVRDLWSHLDLEITIINLDARTFDRPPYFIRNGDGRGLTDYADGSFDIVHSNSVIEHVGHWSEMTAMANEIRRVGKRYFVQTPNYAFPYEPHYRTLFFHWLSESRRARMLVKHSRGFCDKMDSLSDAMLQVQAINLLTSSQVQALFPDARIHFETVYGLRKSIMAVR